MQMKFQQRLTNQGTLIQQLTNELLKVITLQNAVDP